MNKQAIRDRFNSLCKNSPHCVLRLNWKGDEPTVTTIYNGYKDVRFQPEHTGNQDSMSRRYQELGIVGIQNLSLEQAENIIQESKQFYRN